MIQAVLMTVHLVHPTSKMAKPNLFTIEQLEKKGYVLNEQTGEYEPKNLHVFPKSFTEPNNDIVGEIPEVKIDIKTEWKIEGNVPSKKNSRNIFVMNGRLMNLPSDKHKEYVVATAMQYTVFGFEFRRAVKVFGLQYPLYVEFTFIRSTKHAFDYDNVCATIVDLMKDEYKTVKQEGKKVKVLVSRNFIPDDSADYILPSFKPYQYDKENPGVLIRLITNK